MKARYKIYNVDALDWLAKRRFESIHAVVTDPPYGVVEYSPKEQLQLREGKGLWRLPQAYDGVIRKAVPRFTILSAAEHRSIYEFQRAFSSALFPILVPGAHAIVASNTLFSHLVAEGFVESGFELRGQIARIVRTLRGGDRPKHAHADYPDVSVSPRSCWEPWLIFRKPAVGKISENLARWGTGGLRRPETGGPFVDLIASNPARGEERKISSHPSLKPQAFIRQLVRAALPLGEGIVLDPFMGSGSTVAAASALGLRGIGLERDSKYFEAAAHSIRLLRDLA